MRPRPSAIVALLLVVPTLRADERLVRTFAWSGGAPIAGFVLVDQDPDGFLWASSPTGLFRFDGKWTPVALPAGFAGRPVFAIASADGAAIMGTDAGLARVGGAGGAAVLTPSEGIPAGRITAVAVTDGVVVAGSAGGLALVRGW